MRVELSGLSLGDDVEGVEGGRWGDLLLCAIGPADFDGVDFGRGAEAEVRALVGTRGEAAAGQDIGALAKAVGGEVDNRSHRVAGRLSGRR